MSAYNKGLSPDKLSEARKLFERELWRKLGDGVRKAA
jgi:hypothetical protein